MEEDGQGMTDNSRLTRRQALQSGAAGALGIYLAGCGSSGGGGGGGGTVEGGGNINWITWNDHYLPAQLKAVQQSAKLAIHPTLQSDDSDGYLKTRQTGNQFQFVSTDALWVQKFHKDGLIESFDIDSIEASSELFSMAKSFDFWQDGSNYLAYPFGWSSIQFYYDPKHVSPAPTSWHVLTDPKYKGKVVAENQPTDLMAMAGIATGSKQPYNMSPDEISKAKDFLKAAKPAFLKLVSQNSDVVKALADGSAVLAIENLGTDFRVKDAGGPEVKMAQPKEGVYGFIDGEQIVKASNSGDQFVTFINAMETADWIAQNFIANGRPLFNEKAYKLLVDQGHQDRADQLLYNKPEIALGMTLKGPSGNEQAYIDAFNEVFGA
jgi:spermidine/putrescine transport system substrate-binding protein